MTEAVQLSAAFPVAATLGATLHERRLTIAFAESCTGGLLGAALTAVPGASDYVVGGVIAYADAVKSDMLGVSRHLLAEEGAVSEDVAVAMAEGVRERLAADIGVAITGVAGPGAEPAGKPAGLAFVAVSWRLGSVAVRLEGDHGREANRALAVREALDLCAAALRRMDGAGSPGGESR